MELPIYQIHIAWENRHGLWFVQSSSAIAAQASARRAFFAMRPDVVISVIEIYK